MVNHVYTLLANRPGQGFATGDGEEYTPPGYRPVALPDYLLATRAVLYGADPDRRTVAHRTRQFVALLHASTLADQVTAADPRLTYLPLASASFELVPAVAVTALDGQADTLYVAGPAPQGLVAGRAESAWTVTAAGASLAVAGDRGDAATTPLVFTSGLSQPVPVPGTALVLRVRPDVAPGVRWRVAAAGRPDADLGVVLARLATAGAGVLDELFGLAPAEPYLSWRNLWRSRLPLPERLGAVLLAVAARTDDVRTGRA